MREADDLWIRQRLALGEMERHRNCTDYFPEQAKQRLAINFDDMERAHLEPACLDNRIVLR